MKAVSRRVTRILAISQPRTGPPDSPASAVRLLPVNLTRSISSMDSSPQNSPRRRETSTVSAMQDRCPHDTGRHAALPMWHTGQSMTCATTEGELHFSGNNSWPMQQSST